MAGKIGGKNWNPDSENRGGVLCMLINSNKATVTRYYRVPVSHGISTTNCMGFLPTPGHNAPHGRGKFLLDPS